VKSLVFSAVLLWLAASFADAKSRHCMLRVHVEANARDTVVFASSVRAQFSGKEIAIEKIPRISENDVVAFYPYSAEQGDYGVIFQLNDHGRLALDALSVEHRGGLLFVFVNGRPVSQLQIDKRVSDGRIYVASGLTTADIDLMKKDWRLLGQKR
jgi:hypothetical protein